MFSIFLGANSNHIVFDFRMNNLLDNYVDLVAKNNLTETPKHSDFHPFRWRRLGVLDDPFVQKFAGDHLYTPVVCFHHSDKWMECWNRDRRSRFALLHCVDFHAPLIVALPVSPTDSKVDLMRCVKIGWLFLDFHPYVSNRNPV